MLENGHMDHYFPQWLMRNWCDEKNEIWCFDKRIQKVKKKGTACFGRERDLYKSDIIDLDLEATTFAQVDNKHGGLTDAMMLYSMFGKHKRVPNDYMRYFIELCLWTSIRNKRVQGWTDIEDFKSDVAPDHILHAWTDVELTKAIHLRFCKLCEDGVMESEIKRFQKDYLYFFVGSDDKFITSDVAVQEYGNKFAERWLDCKPVADDECSVIMFPLYPSIMFVATRHKEYADCHRYFVLADEMVKANYSAHINSAAEELYFPYPIYDTRTLPTENVGESVLKRVKGVPCAIDLEQHKELGAASIIHSNWTGT